MLRFPVMFEVNPDAPEEGLAFIVRIVVPVYYFPPFSSLALA